MKRLERSSEEKFAAIELQMYLVKDFVARLLDLAAIYKSELRHLSKDRSKLLRSK